MGNDPTWCDHCGEEVQGKDFVPYSELPFDVASANKGESAVLCTACNKALTIKEFTMGIEFKIPNDWVEGECPLDCPLRCSTDDGGYCTLKLEIDEDSHTLRPSRKCPGPGTYKVIRVMEDKKE